MTTIPEENLDRRSKRSRKWLKSALKDLLAEQNFDDISITDISERADVSRYTFYKHFESKEDLLIKALEDKFESMYSQLDSDIANAMLDGSNLRDYKSVLLNPLFKHENKSEPILKLGLDRFSQKVLKTVESQQLEIFQQFFVKKKFDQPNEDSLDILNTFFAGGVVNLMAKWLQEDLPYEEGKMDRVLGLFAHLLLIEGLLTGEIDKILED